MTVAPIFLTGGMEGSPIALWLVLRFSQTLRSRFVNLNERLERIPPGQRVG
jgi:hypothetical protein